MKPYLFILLFSFLPMHSQNCNCLKDTMDGWKESNEPPNATFSFKNGSKIILCGYEDNIDNVVYYGEFILLECGKAEPIDFWDGALTCRAFMENDILKVEELCNLPVGKDRDFVFTPWLVEELSYKKGELNRVYFTKSIRKYSKEEIKQTLDEYTLAVKEGLPDYSEDLVAKLFVAALSGDKKATDYFKAFPDTFLTDGGLSETYKEFSAMYELMR